MRYVLNIFTYGTLMSKEIWKNVVIGNYKFVKVKLSGYSRRKLADREYPGLIKSENSTVEGIIYFDVTKQDVDIHQNKPQLLENVLANLNVLIKLI